MQAYNKRFEIKMPGFSPSSLLPNIQKFLKKSLPNKHSVLRFAIVEIENDDIFVETTVLDETNLKINNFQKLERTSSVFDKSFVLAHIVPTGIKAEIGGYVGDATPATCLLGAASSQIIVHPNVVNGGIANYMPENAVYVEGYWLDEFFLGNVGFRKTSKSNKIGVIIDSGCTDPTSFESAINTINFKRSNLGLDIVFTRTKQKAGSRAIKTKSGAFMGEVENISTLVEAGRCLIQKEKVDVLAVATEIAVEEKHLLSYLKGEGANPYGGTEAVISHALCKILKIMAAHAPLLSSREKSLIQKSGVLDPRAASEGISPGGYLGCILVGLSKAPLPVPIPNCTPDDLTVKNIKAVIVPADCLGGVPVLSSYMRAVPIIAVEENKTVLCVTAEKLKLKNFFLSADYLSAAKLLATMQNKALDQILNVVSRESLRRPIKSAKEI